MFAVRRAASAAVVGLVIGALGGAAIAQDAPVLRGATIVALGDPPAPWRPTWAKPTGSCRYSPRPAQTS